MNTGVRWIDNAAELRQVVDRLVAGPVAVDTEADSFHHYRDKVCLIQLSWDGGDALVDPLAGLDLELLAGPFGDPSVRKVLHGADYDLRILDRDHGLRFRGVFDTMVAARLVGERRFGLASLAERHLGVRLDKSHQRGDWSRRPLPADMATYAVEDTRHLIMLAQLLEERLRALGRIAWAEEEFRRLEQVRWNATAPDPETFRRVKGSAALDSLGLAVLRELFAWRDAKARERDVPAFRVLRDEILVALARERPARPAELGAIRGLPRLLAQGAPAREVLRAVRVGLDLPPEGLPRSTRTERVRPDPAFETRVRALRSHRDALARELDLEAPVLAGRAALEEVQRRLDAGKPWDTVPEIRGWRAELLRRVL